MDMYTKETGRFIKAGLRGTSRAIGKLLGNDLVKRNPGYADFLKNGPFKADEKHWKDLDELMAACDAACPGLPDELAGFAEALGARLEDIAFWNFTALKGANCSHAALLPETTADGHCLVMRSYEWNHREDDLTLASTAVEGAYRHLGFSCLLFGRLDGMNEHGLSVTMSGGMAAGLPKDWRYKKGLNFWVVIRGLLERCRDVYEAKTFLLDQLPTGNHLFILADASGKALLVEMQGGAYAFKECANGFVAATNHYMTPALSGRNRLAFIMDKSAPRLDYLERRLAAMKGSLNPTVLQDLMAGRIPNGCFGPWYNEGFGTLWQSVFDLSAAKAWYCLGSPGFNPWREADFSIEDGLREESVIFAIEGAAER